MYRKNKRCDGIVLDQANNWETKKKQIHNKQELSLEEVAPYTTMTSP